jgi:DNA-binding FrmR family transcriptional regulator
MSGEKQHPHKERKAVLNRLSKIEGHVRSIRTMIENDRPCSDILMQLSAVRSAIDKVGKIVLEDHLESCLIKTGEHPDENETWAGVKEALDRFFN